MSLTPGLVGEAELTATAESTAAAVGSGSVAVLATPVLIGLMEAAAVRAVQPHLAEGETTVGTAVNVRHVAATPVGLQVRAKAALEQVDGRRLVFRVEAFDDREQVGIGTHERYIVQSEKFQARAERKRLSNLL